MATHNLRGLFSAIADAIRAKTGGSADIVADDFPTAIAAIPTGSSPTIANGVTYDTFDANGKVTAVTVYGDMQPYECAYLDALNLVIFNGTIQKISYGAFRNCSALGSFSVPNGVTSIEAYAFQSAGLSGGVSIPNSVATIGTYAFYSCNLPSLSLPSNITRIEAWSYGNNASVTAITIPSNVTYIGNNAFKGCLLNEIHMLSDLPPTLQNVNAFGDLAANGIIYVPRDTEGQHRILDLYQSASQWAVLKDQMQEEPA